MALIICPDCGTSVSSRAVACVKCGCPIAEVNVTETAAQYDTKHSSATGDLDDDIFGEDDFEDEDINDDDDDDDFLDDELDGDLEDDLDDDDYTSDKNDKASRREKRGKREESAAQIRQFRSFDEIRMAGGLSTLTAKEIEWFRMNRVGRIASQPPGTRGVQIITAHDLNGDGTPDMFVAHNTEQIGRAISDIQNVFASWNNLRKQDYVCSAVVFVITFVVVFCICISIDEQYDLAVLSGLMMGGVFSGFFLFFAIDTELNK